jgi:rod shape-determining protein MreD
MQNFIFFVFCLVLTYIQVSALPIFFEVNRIPSLILSFIVSIVILRGFQWSVKWILLLGILMDIFSFQLLGINILGFLAVAVVAYEIRSAYHLRAKRILFLVMLEIIVFISMLSFSMSKALAAKLIALTTKYAYQYTLNVFSLDYLLSIFYTLIFAVPVYIIASRFIAWLFRSQNHGIVRG